MIGLSIGSLLFGQEGLALVTIAAAAMIPTANVLSVYALIAHADQPHGPAPNPLLALLKNPIVIACIVGLCVAAANIELPELLDDSLRILGDAALALGLLSAGAGVDLSALKRAGPRTLVWSLVRLIGLPAFAVASASCSACQASHSRLLSSAQPRRPRLRPISSPGNLAGMHLLRPT